MLIITFKFNSRFLKLSLLYAMKSDKKWNILHDHVKLWHPDFRFYKFTECFIELF